jgi:hypothetical protein
LFKFSSHYYLCFVQIFSKVIIRRVRIVAKSSCSLRHVRPSVCLSASLSVLVLAYINAAPTGQISLKFDIEEFYKNLSQKIQICVKLYGNVRQFSRRPK